MIISSKNRYIATFGLMLTTSILISACSTAPKKSSTVSQQDRVAQLSMTALDRRLDVPVDGIKRQQLTDTWGASRSRGRSHEGIDIMAPKGTKVYSATDGIVRSLQGNKLGGTVVWVMGPGQSWHYYAHLDRHSRKIKEGDFVQKGTLLGYVGHSGNASRNAPHLHYGIYLSGKGRGAVNPYPYLR